MNDVQQLILDGAQLIHATFGLGTPQTLAYATLTQTRQRYTMSGGAQVKSGAPVTVATITAVYRPLGQNAQERDLNARLTVQPGYLVLAPRGSDVQNGDIYTDGAAGVALTVVGALDDPLAPELRVICERR